MHLAIVLILASLSATPLSYAAITIASYPESRLFTTGTAIAITCTYTSDYVFDSFVHPVYGQIGSTADRFEVTHFSNPPTVTLEIDSAIEEDDGTYFCTFDSVSSSKREHVSISMEYRNPPMFVNPQQSYEAIVGESMTLRCATEHATTVGWFRNGNLIQSSARITSDSEVLTFHTVLLADAGAYRCLAGNELLLEGLDVNLNVAQRPTVDVDQSTRIRMVNLGDTAEFVCTVQGFPLPSVKWVEVSTGAVVSEENTETVAVDSITFKYHLRFSNISDGDIGSYKCEATNSAGIAETRVILNLIGTVGAIQNVVLTLVNQTNLLVTWDAPLAANILSYTVTWQPVNSDSPQSYTLNGPDPPTRYTITGLERLTTYSVFVYASNDHGRGVDSEQSNATTDAVAPSGRVRLFLFDISPFSTQMEVDLSAVDDGGANVTIIELLYTVDGQSWHSREVRAGAQGYLSGLQPDTEYQLRARPGNRIGFGSRSDLITFRTSPEGYPGSPSHVTVFQRGSDAFLVCWEKSQVGSPFLHYDINGVVTDGEAAFWNVSAAGLLDETTSECAAGVIVSGLSPDSCYRFSVSVTNAQGTGQSSALSSETCTPPLLELTPSVGSPLTNALSNTVIIVIVVVVAVLFAVTLGVCLLVCCCCCLRLRQKQTKYNLPESNGIRRESARSDTHLIPYQHQSSLGSVSSESSPRTASTQLSNPFVFEPSPQPTDVHTGSNTSGSNTLGPTYPDSVPQQPSTHSLPSYYRPQHAQPSAPIIYPPLPPNQDGFEMINNPYYKKFQLQNIPEQEEHINYAYASMPPPLPSRTYHTDNMSEVAPSEVSSIQMGESCSQPSSSPRLKKKKKHRHSPNRGPLQTQGEVDGTELTGNNAYESVPVPPAVGRGVAITNQYNAYIDMESELSQPRFEIQSREPGAVFETVRFKPES